MSGLPSTSPQVWMLSWRALFWGNLYLLMVTAAERNVKEVENTRRTPSLIVHMKELTDTWMEKKENELKNNMQKLQKVLNQLVLMKHQIQDILLSIDEQENDLKVQSVTLKRLYLQNSDANPLTIIAEGQQQIQMKGLHSLKKRLKQLLGHNNSTLHTIQDTFLAVSSIFNFRLQYQRELLETLREVTSVMNQGPGAPRLGFQSCDDIHRSGLSMDTVYTIMDPNLTEPKRVFCAIDTDGHAWTVIQRRVNGTVNFKQNWQEYKQGFGDPAGEHWLGNEVVHQLTSSKNYSLRVELEDWEGKSFSANYQNFRLGSEGQFYRIFLAKHSGIAWYGNELILDNNNFSTYDADHDICPCNCAQELSGGWWFDNCGPSNLNGIYYPAGQHLHKINGIRWHHSPHGPSESFISTRMMIRPLLT